MSGRVGPRLGPEQVGQRVVVRRRLPGGRYADVLGELLAWDDPPGEARVLARTGEVRVALADVVAGKAVPPPPERKGAPHRAIGLERLEDVMVDGWRPLETDWLGGRGTGWRLRAAEGFTGRANSALAVGDPGLPLPDAVAAVERWYRERGLRPRFAQAWPVDDRTSDLDALLAERGYELDTPTLVMTAAAREVAAAVARGGVDARPVDLADEPDDAWLALYRYRGQQLPDVARRLLVNAPAQVFASVRTDDATVAVGRAASARGWTGITAMEVAESHRRRGLARVVLGRLAEWALERGDRSLYLQVAEHNAAARALYGSVGFAVHHGYHYRLAPPG